MGSPWWVQADRWFKEVPLAAPWGLDFKADGGGSKETWEEEADTWAGSHFGG